MQVNRNLETGHIYNQNGQWLKHRDLSFADRSPIETKIRDELNAVFLSTPAGERQMLSNLEEYGFAILKTKPGEKAVINRAFDAFEKFSKNTPMTEKKVFTQNQGSIDAKYNSRKPGEGSRPMEEISAMRDFYFKPEYDNRWPDAAAELKLASQELINVLEHNSQEVLRHIAKLFKANEDLFEDIAYNSDQSTLRMIHCISKSEYDSKPDTYYDEDGWEDWRRGRPDNDCVQLHTDWGLITLLPTARGEGLEFWYDDPKGKNSGWVRLKSEPGDLILMPGNVADLISRGKLRSIPHRVISGDEQDRYSLAYFTEVKRGVNLEQLRDSLHIPEKTDEDISYYEHEIRPKILPEHHISSDNYLLYMLEGRNPKPRDETIEHARSIGLELARKE